MNRSARRKMLRVVGIIMVVMLPVMLALWFAQLRAVSETSAQLRTFAENIGASSVPRDTVNIC